ncbi:MAG: RAMP superfamily CRISPR-associated protein, partial [Dehalococcoidia bacterium]|nr:RAMP superfamily CRISPR-associated protein [Dehalococcoidia bacterium]
MTSAQHRHQPSVPARAPYNFVPLPDRVVSVAPSKLPDHDRFHPDRHSGYFDVTLTTETPLYIRGLLKEHEALNPDASRNKPDFFAINGEPVIPGSSLRGMLRSMVEIITFSKLQPMSDRQLMYRAVGDMTSLGESYRTMVLGPNQARRPEMLFDYPS